MALPEPIGADTARLNTNIEIERIVERFVREKWPNGGRCRNCGGAPWSFFVGHATTLVVRDPTGVGQRFALPTAVLVCQTCGTTEFLNLVIAGVPRRLLDRL